MIEGKESNNAKYNGNPEMAFGTDQSSNFRASAVIAYPKQDPQASIKASGSRDPNSHIPVDKETLLFTTKDNYTVNLKVVKKMFRNNGTDFNTYLEAVNCSPKGTLAKSTIRWRITATRLPVFFDFSKLVTRAFTGEYKALRNFKIVFLRQAMLTGKSLLKPLYVLPLLLKVMYLEKVQRVRRVQKVVVVEKVAEKAVKVKVLRKI
jgi:hypothetical protein